MHHSIVKTKAQALRILLVSAGLLILVGSGALAMSAEQQVAQAQRSPTQPTLDRQVEQPQAEPEKVAPKSEQPQAPSANQLGHEKQTAPAKAKAAIAAASARKSSLAAQQNYDKYQLKATNSYNSAQPAAAPATSSSRDSEQQAAASAKQQSSSSSQVDDGKASAAPSSVANKKAAPVASKPKSTFSLLKKFLPSFMSSAAAPMAAAAAAAASAVVDKQQSQSAGQHSRSSHSGSEGIIGKASGKIINLISGVGKKDGGQFLVRKTNIDRQAGFSGLLSNPLSLGLLFSAPLIPSLLLTPLAIAGLSPAMSAINNFFGDEEEPEKPTGPLSAMLSGSNSPLSSFLSQASGSSSGSATSSSGSPSTSESAPVPSFALKAMQSFLGPPATTEKPLFNPGMFASQGIQNAAASLSGNPSGSNMMGNAIASAAGASSSSNSNSPFRNFLTGGGSGGGSLMQAAASIISPTFAAPPSGSSSSSSSSSDSDDGPGFMQVASEVFDKVASYMGAPGSNSQESNKDLMQASSSPSGSSSAGSNSNMSPLSTLVGLSNFSPFQLSSLLASSPLASAISPVSSSSGSSAGQTQKAGFFSTLRNVYELFSSSFLRRQEVGDSNECQQRLICELHQRAMNSRLFRRSLQTNLNELASLDRTLQEHIRSSSIQARIDNDTKQMLNDFLKATNNFRAGRELVNCSKMYPKCSRAMLLSAANAHLADPVSGKAIGKFSNLMKKMKYKSAQQHQSQWKLRKPSKATASVQVPQEPRTQLSAQFPPTDYLQVAPMSPINSGKQQLAGGRLTPADSLKLVQQIMLMSQQQQQAQLQPQASQQYAMQMAPTGQYKQQQYSSQPQQVAGYPTYTSNNQQQPQQQSYNPQQATTYTDAIAPSMYSSSTDSPYFSIQPQQPQPPVPQNGAAAATSAEMSPQPQGNYQPNYLTSVMPAADYQSSEQNQRQQPQPAQQQQVQKQAMAV